MGGVDSKTLSHAVHWACFCAVEGHVSSQCTSARDPVSICPCEGVAHHLPDHLPPHCVWNTGSVCLSAAGSPRSDLSHTKSVGNLTCSL